ncbi:protein of unknown function [Aminobacter niigataensis]|nr:protein of unknown function [Aminobacter niigataensis]
MHVAIPNLRSSLPYGDAPLASPPVCSFGMLPFPARPRIAFLGAVRRFRKAGAAGAAAPGKCVALRRNRRCIAKSPCRVSPHAPSIARSEHASPDRGFHPRRERRRFLGLAEGLVPVPSMKRPYKNRCGQGKAESNAFLMNLLSPRPDSKPVCVPRAAKAFVIQTLFRGSKKTGPCWKKL